MRYRSSAIKLQRVRRGWTRQELAQRAGIDRKTVEYLERGVTAPNARTLARLATALGVSANCFFESAV